MLPLVSLIIPTHKRPKKLKRLLNSINKSNYPKKRLEIIVVQDKKRKLVSYCRNQGIKKAKGDYLFFIDDDVVLDSETILNLVKFMEKKKKVWLLGPLILNWYQPEKIWFAGLKINPWTLQSKFFTKLKNYSPIKTDALLTSFMVRQQLIKQIGGFNDQLLPFGFEDLDFCFRAKLIKCQPLVLPQAKVFHDHKTGAGFALPWRLYLIAKTRLIAAKLWSQNPFHTLVTQITSIFYLILSLVITLVLIQPFKNSLSRIQAVFRGIKDGFQAAKQILSYQQALKIGKKVKYSYEK